MLGAVGTHEFSVTAELPGLRLFLSGLSGWRAEGKEWLTKNGIRAAGSGSEGK